MSIFILDRESIIKQTVQNMVEAKVVNPEEGKKLTGQILKLDPKDLLTALVGSHMLREQAVEPITWYPIGEIYSN